MGDRVALVLPTGPDFVACFFGVFCAGAVPVPLYPPVRLGKLDEYHRRTAAMLRAADSALVVTEERIHRSYCSQSRRPGHDWAVSAQRTWVIQKGSRSRWPPMTSR